MNELIDALRCESVINDEHPKCESCKYGKVVFRTSREEDVYGCDSRRIENDAANALERLMAEVDRKDKALQAWVNTWESRKENAIRHICDHCDTPIDVRLKDGACEDCPIITLVKEIFDEQQS